MIFSFPLLFVSILFLSLPIRANLYPKSSSVLSLNGEDYDRIIAQSNYTSIVEFYSPHCIHCKNLIPIYEKVAQRLSGLARVAAVNCEKESNMQFCDRNGIRGFPTLKIVKPGKKPGKPIVEEYNGARSTKAIVETVIEKIPNFVEKPSNINIDKWIKDTKATPLAILFTKKPKINPLLKALAIEFKDSIKFAHVQVSEDDDGIDKKYDIKKLPTLMLIKEETEHEYLRYEGDMKKDKLVEFLSQAALPNPDPAPAKVTKITDQSSPQEYQAQKSVKTSVSITPLIAIEKEDELITKCLGPKTGTCLLSLRPKIPDQSTLVLVDALTQLQNKPSHKRMSSIPVYILPEVNPKYTIIKDTLKLEENGQVLAINGKRRWWTVLNNLDFSSQSLILGSLETWISAIQVGESEKKELPSELILEKSENPVVEFSSAANPSDDTEVREDNKNLPENSQNPSKDSKDSSGDGKVPERIEKELENDHDEL